MLKAKTKGNAKMTFTQKETQLLNDLKSKEQLCIDKYTKYACSACDGELKTLFTKISNVESGHLNTINTLIAGNMPQSNGGSGDKPTAPANATYNSSDSKSNECYKNDCYLCSDILDTEKHVSSVYDTCIFEFKDTNVRSLLNHIQKEEQEHGEAIYKYMALNGMYN